MDNQFSTEPSLSLQQVNISGLGCRFKLGRSWNIMIILFTQISAKQAGRRHGSLASMSLCKYRSSAHLLQLTRTSVNLTGKLVCDVARLVSIMIIVDDVISDVIRPRSTIREDHIDTPYSGTLC